MVSDLYLKHLKTVGVFFFLSWYKVTISAVLAFFTRVRLWGSVGRPADLSLLHLPCEPRELGSIACSAVVQVVLINKISNFLYLSPQHQRYSEYWRHSELITGTCHSHSNIKVEWLQCKSRMIAIDFSFIQFVRKLSRSDLYVWFNLEL